MSVYREKEFTGKRDEKPYRNSSASRKDNSETSCDKKPVITQGKPRKMKSSELTATRKTKEDKTKILKPENRHRKTISDDKEIKGSLEESKRTEKLREHKIKGDTKTDLTHLQRREKEGKISKRNREDDKDYKLKNRRDRTRTRTLSPTEIKQLIPLKMAAGDFESKVTVNSDNNEDDENEEDEYADDFEDYESDFEEDESDDTPARGEQVNEEKAEKAERDFRPMNEVEIVKKEFSKFVEETAVFAVSPQPQKFAEEWKIKIQKQELEDIKKSIEKENMEVMERRIPKAAENGHIAEEPERSTDRIRGPLIDFSLASKRQKRNKEVAAAKRRGEELLRMISLDAVSYNIFEIPPTPYEEYIKAFGRLNSKQAYVQTNEDDLDEEVQTEEVLTSNKWTQNPVDYIGRRRNDGTTRSGRSFVLTKEERLGVGGDLEQSLEDDSVGMTRDKTNRLLNFLSWAGQVVLSALERRSGNFLNLENMPNRSKDMGFGDGYAEVNVSGITLLKSRTVQLMYLLPKNNKRLLSVHVQKNEQFQRSFVCVWSLQELSKPLRILTVFNRVTSCCFGPNPGNLVFSGLSDGAVCLWDLREPSLFHVQQTADSFEWTLYSPTYTTAGNWEENEHNAAVVAVRLLSRVEGANRFHHFVPIQICSLDRSGTVTIWSIVQLEISQKNAPAEDMGLAHWGRVKLVKNSSFSAFCGLRDEIPGLYITCSDLLINEADDDDGFYIANSFGSVQHCCVYGSPMKPYYFVPTKQDAIIEATCLELCPFSGRYFLVGCGDGSVRLHARHQEYSLITLNPRLPEDERRVAVVALSWLHSRPCIFFVLDAESRIYIWNLGVSDMHPETSYVPTQRRITCMKLLSSSSSKQIPFMVVGTEDGSIEIHRLKKEYGCRSAADFRNEKNMFLKYVSIL